MTQFNSMSTSRYSFIIPHKDSIQSTYNNYRTQLQNSPFNKPAPPVTPAKYNPIPELHLDPFSNTLTQLTPIVTHQFLVT